MHTTEQPTALSTFASLNSGYQRVFKPEQLTLGLVVPLESYATQSLPVMEEHLGRVQLAEKLGFSAVWLRDVPFHVPSFGDTGQLFDPFVYLGWLASQTTDIALGVASLILPLRHPAHIAKAAASVDQLSAGRLLLGVASGDRPAEYPAMNINYEDRGALFRDSFNYIRRIAQKFPQFSNSYGSLTGDVDMLPKPYGQAIPLLITGALQQAQAWLAKNGDGWITYPRPLAIQQQLVQQFRQSSAVPRPVMEPLYIDLTADANQAPEPIHLGVRLGINQLANYLKARQAIGINHIALNLRFNRGNTEETLHQIAEQVLPALKKRD